MNIYVRGAGEPAPILRSIPPVVARLDPNLPIEDLKTPPQQVRENVFLDRMISTLSASSRCWRRCSRPSVARRAGIYGVAANT
jgi:hypothetical protein